MLYFDQEATIHLFETEEERLEKCRQWGYVSATAKTLKPLFYKYQHNRFEPCEVVGFLVPAQSNHQEIVVVVEVLGQRGMIHKDYLKEMQEMKKKFDKLPMTQPALF